MDGLQSGFLLMVLWMLREELGLLLYINQLTRKGGH